MSVSPDDFDTRVPDARPAGDKTGLGIILAAVTLIALTIISLVIAENGFQDRVTLELADALVGSSEGARLSFLDSLGRAATISILLVIDAFPGLSVVALPALTIIAATFFVGMLASRLERQGWPSVQTVIVVIAILLHPLFLRAATSGNTIMLSALAFFSLMYVFERLEHVGDVQSQMNVGLGLSAVVLVDPDAVYLMLPLMVLLPVVYRELRDFTSTAAALLMIALPPLIGLSTFFFLHLVLSPASISQPFNLWASALHGFVGRIGDYDWIIHYGGELITPFAFLMAGILVCAPGHLVVLWRLSAARAERNRPGAALAALAVPAIAGSLATYQMHARSAWPYLLAGLMAFLVWLITKPLPNYVRHRALLLLLLGSLAAWMYPPIWAERGAAAWRAALITEIPPPGEWQGVSGSWFDPRAVTEPSRGFSP